MIVVSLYHMIGGIVSPKNEITFSVNCIGLTLNQILA